MTGRTFRTGRWLEKARRAGIDVRFAPDLSHLQFRVPASYKTRTTVASLMGEVFGGDPDEAARRLTNLNEVVFRRSWGKPRAPVRPDSATLA